MCECLGENVFFWTRHLGDWNCNRCILSCWWLGRMEFLALSSRHTKITKVWTKAIHWQACECDFSGMHDKGMLSSWCTMTHCDTMIYFTMIWWYAVYHDTMIYCIHLLCLFTIFNLLRSTYLHELDWPQCFELRPNFLRHIRMQNKNRS